ncbi:hypothetical protein PAXRUDRAFT_799078 [Paxillus rubicundulus Ve08.2h10]|uniref:Uncharacterized protein n=1 Tax=Paxillus rubicundulus Ve08.2h10 TaxID=930991 RepID=A0A0D0C9Y1_9AGAM|nr:hypothetical protein PAXRUDRAFT_799078 [Paxillus rubicundulus Ve08.2h10]
MSGRGRGRGRAKSTKDETFTNFHIVWETTTYTGRTSKMVKWLVDHPINCIILFSEDRSAPHPEGWASGRTKLEICAIIADLIFKNDEDYAVLFATHAAKFAKAVQDCLRTLKKGYHEEAVKFTQTGNGIALNSDGHSNLLHKQFKRSFCGILIFTFSGWASPHTPQRLSSNLHLVHLEVHSCSLLSKIRTRLTPLPPLTLPL